MDFKEYTRKMEKTMRFSAANSVLFAQAVQTPRSWTASAFPITVWTPPLVRWPAFLLPMPEPW